MSNSILGLALLATTALGQMGSLPTISVDGPDLHMSTPGGDVHLMVAGQQMYLGATLSTLQSTVASQAAAMQAMNSSLNDLAMNAAMTSDVAQMYLTQSAASSMYQPQSLMSNYATLQQATALSDSAQEYADDLVNALANLINSSYADIINSHIALGVLSPNGTYNGNIVINGDTDLVSMQALLNHVVHITGNLVINNVNSAITDLGVGLFSRCTSIGGYLYLQNNAGLQTLGAGFPLLQTIGGQLLLSNNQNLASIGSAFANLTSIGGALTITNSPSLGSSTGPNAFASLASVGGQTLGSGFSASTGIYVGDITSGDISSIATMLANKQVYLFSILSKGVLNTSQRFSY